MWKERGCSHIMCEKPTLRHVQLLFLNLNMNMMMTTFNFGAEAFLCKRQC